MTIFLNMLFELIILMSSNFINYILPLQRMFFFFWEWGLSYANQHTTTCKFSQILLWLIQLKNWTLFQRTDAKFFMWCKANSQSKQRVFKTATICYSKIILDALFQVGFILNSWDVVYGQRSNRCYFIIKEYKNY